MCAYNKSQKRCGVPILINTMPRRLPAARRIQPRRARLLALQRKGARKAILLASAGFSWPPGESSRGEQDCLRSKEKEREKQEGAKRRGLQRRRGADRQPRS